MSERVNRRTQILEAAATLFVEHGYKATSIRQIADMVSCTEAAIYYHFKDGKQALFQAVVEANMPDLGMILDECRHATSLNDLITRYGKAIYLFLESRSAEFRWIVAEFLRLSTEEQEIFRVKVLRFQSEFKSIISRFVRAEAPVDHITWSLMVAMFGYSQVFHNVGLHRHTEFSPEILMGVLAQGFEAAFAR